MDISRHLCRPDIFDELRKDEESFSEIVAREIFQTVQYWGHRVDLSSARLYDAYEFWKNDLERVKFHELATSSDLDHFKQAAHLMYWLRRTNPINDLFYAEADPTDEEQPWHDLVKLYGIQFTSFQIGFDLCRFFESERMGSIFYTNEYELDYDYYATVCHMFKTKNVSPHSVFLIYKSLFFDPLGGARVVVE